MSLHYLVKCQCLKSNSWTETTSVATHLKKLTTENSMFIVSVIVLSNCHILQFLRQMFNVSALLLDDTMKPATPLTNGANFWATLCCWVQCVTRNNNANNTISFATHRTVQWVYSNATVSSILRHSNHPIAHACTKLRSSNLHVIIITYLNRWGGASTGRLRPTSVLGHSLFEFIRVYS